MRRVVITGLGAVTPLGAGELPRRVPSKACALTCNTGVQTSWRRLIAGQTGIVALDEDRFKTIPCRVAGLVPKGNAATGGWNPEEWLEKGVCMAEPLDDLPLMNHQDARKMALFAQYAYAAAQEAVRDAGIQDMSDEERESVVRISISMHFISTH